MPYGMVASFLSIKASPPNVEFCMRMSYVTRGDALIERNDDSKGGACMG